MKKSYISYCIYNFYFSEHFRGRYPTTYVCYFIFRMLSFSCIYAINAWLLLSPSALCCDWSLGSIPLVTSLSDIANIWSLLLYLGIAILGIRVLVSRDNRVTSGMGLALTVVPFLPASGILFRVGFVIAER